MTTLSLLINVISLSIAAVMTTIVVRMWREERARSEARTAVLAQMAHSDFLPEAEPFADEPDAPDATSGAVFSLPDHVSPRHTRVVIPAAAVVVLLLVVGAFRSHGSSPGQARGAAAAAPLELVALHHQQKSGHLTVSGRVQNPRGAKPVANLTATVFLFGPDGAFMTSGRSPLDVATLPPGGESAFVVEIPVNGTVNRYRVSFRDNTDHAVGHVDRRAGAALVRNQ